MLARYSFKCHTYTGCLKKKYSDLIYDNFLMNKAIKLEKVSLDRGKTNLNFDILHLYFTENIAQLLMFKIGCIFLDVCKICKNRCIKYQIKHQGRIQTDATMRMHQSNF